MTAVVIPFPTASAKAAEPKPVVYVQPAETAVPGWFEVVLQVRPNLAPVILGAYEDFWEAHYTAYEIEKDQGAVYPVWYPNGGDAA